MIRAFGNHFVLDPVEPGKQPGKQDAPGQITENYKLQGVHKISFFTSFSVLFASPANPEPADGKQRCNLRISLRAAA